MPGTGALSIAPNAQRGLLRLGQSLHPSDLEPLASQRAQMFAALEIPDGDGPVIPAAGQPAPIGTAPERADRPLMGFLHLHALPARHLPPAQPAVTASTDKPLPARSPGAHALPAVGIPHEHLPGVSLPLAAAARETASAFSVPQLDAAIPARAGQSAAARGKGQSPHHVAMPGERLHAASRSGLLPHDCPRTLALLLVPRLAYEAVGYAPGSCSLYESASCWECEPFVAGLDFAAKRVGLEAMTHQRLHMHVMRDSQPLP